MVKTSSIPSKKIVVTIPKAATKEDVIHCIFHSNFHKFKGKKYLI
jgi:hypothetical protein